MNPAADIWAKVLALMQNEMTTTTINTWFDDTTAVELEGDRFVLYSPTPFKRDIIASRYLPAIQNALRQLGLDRDDVSVEVIERAKSGFLGFGSNPAKVRVSYEVEDGSPKPMMEDLLEEIVGNIYDEFDPQEDQEIIQLEPLSLIHI